MRHNTEQKWVLITGALGGIGKALVEEFSDAGYEVIATDIQDISKGMLSSKNIHFIKSDLEAVVYDETFANQFYLTVKSLTKGNGICSLVNNAAVQILADSRVLTREQWNKSFSVNLFAPFFLSQLFIEDLEKNEGAIVNISSIHATQTKKQFVAYATTKAALSSLTRNMALDIGDKVRINAIEPAAIATEMLRAGFEGEDEKYKQLQKFHPIGRVGTPKEVAKLALFLSSEDAGFVQGACISASGGITGCLSDPA